MFITQICTKTRMNRLELAKIIEKKKVNYNHDKPVLFNKHFQYRNLLISYLIYR